MYINYDDFLTERIYKMERCIGVEGTVIFAVNGKHFPNDKLLSLGTVSHYDKLLKPQLEVYTDNKAPWFDH